MQLKDLPIKRKLIGVIFMTSVSVLVLMCLSLLIYEIYSFRETTRRSLSTMADIIAFNSSAALIFDDPSLARDILAGLRAEPDVTAAAFYNKNGELYATYPATLKSSQFPMRPEADGIAFQDQEFWLFKPVVQGDHRVGTLFMRADLREMYRRLTVYGLVLLVVLLGSAGVALFLSNLFQQQIFRPLTHLANTAKVVSDRKDYSVRATRTSNDELGDLTGAFNSMLDQIQSNQQELERARDDAEQANRAKDDFLAALSHELRTPLNPVLLLASESAGDVTLTADVRAQFNRIAKNVALEAHLIDDLLDVTRIAHGKLQIERGIVDVHSALEDALDTVTADLESKSIALLRQFTAERRVIIGDAVRLQQVFWNVLKNAVKFTPNNGSIVVRTECLDETDEIVVAISDSGIGMTSAELGNIFEAFRQGEHAQNPDWTGHRFGGLGLGLAITKTLVQLHAGTIRASSRGRNQGSSFIIALPLAVPEKIAKSPTNGNGAMPPLQTDGVRVLLVEDHEPTRKALAQLLKRRKFLVETAASLDEARTLADRGEFQLLISDIGLPDGDGYALMMELSRRNVKGIALTGYGMEHDIAFSQSAGFVAHLTKPIHVQSLEEALATALQ